MKSFIFSLVLIPLFALCVKAHQGLTIPSLLSTLAGSTATAALIGLAMYFLILRNLTEALEYLESKVHAVGSGEPLPIFDRPLPNLEMVSLDRSLDQLIRVIEEKQHHEKLANEAISAVKEAEAMAQAKMDFLSRMSHEIRTPLSAMLGYGRLLEEAKLSEEERKYLDSINLSGEFLLEILNEILNLSKLEAGGIELENSAFQLSRITTDVERMIASMARKESVSFRCECDRLRDKWIIADQHRLKQVLLNLIGNALKFTDRGEVVYRLKILQRDADQYRLRFEVEDTGIGLSEEQIPRIFKPFSQGDSDTGKKFGGTGLGLSISRQLVESMGGELLVDSTPGKGSLFYFELDIPVTDPPANRSRKKRRRRISDLRGAKEHKLQILVAEDEAINRNLFGKFFSLLGYQVCFAEDGNDCLKKIESASQPFDVVFLDYHMPYADGLQIASQIRSGELGTGIQKCKLALLTADVLMEDQLTQYEIDTLITKPVNLPELKTFLEFAEAEKAQVSTRSVESNINVLVVEDQELNRNLIGQMVTAFGFNACYANDGVECIEFLQENPDVDIIFLDLRMPRMDGWTVARKIRGGELGARFANIPIAVLSAEVHSEKTCMEIGVNEFIAKPFEADRLRDFVTRVQGNESLVALAN